MSDILITMKNGDTMEAELYPEIAPVTVENFLKLIEDKFFDGLIFHRVIEGFMAQGGDPEGDGTGGAAHTITGEFAENGFTNLLSHQRGVISMARSEFNNSASSQFFICYGDCSFLDGNYAAFGHVTEGLEVLDAVASVATYPNDMPCKKVVIKKMSIVK